MFPPVPMCAIAVGAAEKSRRCATRSVPWRPMFPPVPMRRSWRVRRRSCLAGASDVVGRQAGDRGDSKTDLDEDRIRKKKNPYCCICSCGRQDVVRGSDLTAGTSTQCRSCRAASNVPRRPSRAAVLDPDHEGCARSATSANGRPSQRLLDRCFAAGWWLSGQRAVPDPTSGRAGRPSTRSRASRTARSAGAWRSGGPDFASPATPVPAVGGAIHRSRDPGSRAPSLATAWRTSGCGAGVARLPSSPARPVASQLRTGRTEGAHRSSKRGRCRTRQGLHGALVSGDHGRRPRCRACHATLDKAMRDQAPTSVAGYKARQTPNV